MNDRTYLSVLKNEPEVLTVADISRILRVSRNKAYDLIRNGTIQSIRMGGKIIIPKLCLVRFLTDTESFQTFSQIVPPNLWIFAKDCGMLESTDSQGLRQEDRTETTENPKERKST